MLQSQVDLIDFSGPAFSETDNRVAALRLVQLGLTDAALFDPAGEDLHDACPALTFIQWWLGPCRSTVSWK